MDSFTGNWLSKVKVHFILVPYARSEKSLQANSEEIEPGQGWVVKEARMGREVEGAMMNFEDEEMMCQMQN